MTAAFQPTNVSTKDRVKERVRHSVEEGNRRRLVIRRKGATREQIRQGLDSISLDTANGHYTFTPGRHNGMPQSAVTIAIVRNGQFVPAPGLTPQELATAGS